MGQSASDLFDKSKYQDMFDSLDTDFDGFVTGENVITIFLTSGRTRSDLARIWDLCDIEKKGKLNKDQFVLAMYVIHKYKHMALPSVLLRDMIPSELWPQSSAPTINYQKIEDISLQKEYDSPLSKASVDNIEFCSTQATAAPKEYQDSSLSNTSVDNVDFYSDQATPVPKEYQDSPLIKSAVDNVEFCSDQATPAPERYQDSPLSKASVDNVEFCSDQATPIPKDSDGNPLTKTSADNVADSQEENFDNSTYFHEDDELDVKQDTTDKELDLSDDDNETENIEDYWSRAEAQLKQQLVQKKKFHKNVTKKTQIV